MEPTAEPGAWRLGPASGSAGQVVSIRLRRARVFYLTVPSQSPWARSVGGGSLLRRLREFLPAVQAWLSELALDPSFLELPAAALAERAAGLLLRLRPYVIVLAGDLGFKLLMPFGSACDIRIDLQRCCFLVSSSPTMPADGGAMAFAHGSNAVPSSARLSRHARLSLREVLCAVAPTASPLAGLRATAPSPQGWGGGASGLRAMAQTPLGSAIGINPLSAPAASHSRRKRRFGWLSRSRRRINPVEPEFPMDLGCLSIAPQPNAKVTTLVSARCAQSATLTSALASTSAVAWRVERVMSLTATLLSSHQPTPFSATGACSGGESGGVEGGGGPADGSALGLDGASRLRALRVQLWQLRLRVHGSAAPAERAAWREAGLVTALLELLAWAPAASPAAPREAPRKAAREASSGQPLRVPATLKALQRDALGFCPTPDPGVVSGGEPAG